MNKKRALKELEKIIDQLSDNDFDILRSSIDYLDTYIRSQKEEHYSNKMTRKHIEYYMGCNIYLCDGLYFVDMGNTIDHSCNTLEAARESIRYQKS